MRQSNDMPSEGGIPLHLVVVMMLCVAIGVAVWHWPDARGPVAVSLLAFGVLYRLIRRR
ncbi:hypothetical protein Daura_06115 [Dactylosporangium aurantiacum]|uniref:Uncharacterized protein n=1 Tax=Dactylosporangium aurantiacum TaxID=35754 RepID=A0A9Q9IHN6_9ACTN|nr:hypothetical protein [Dactylosporangium aurantiacum]MDG6108818.1 hypothetical protein [Dactylosporangium aurantiacum]UWZ55776.1 hypothetical protein Daura_06115 [Dactylosporangium aurantiacum]